MKHLFVLSILIGILTSCSDRERLNPFDPHNPHTGGAPVGLTVYSQRDTVWLAWDPLNIDDLTGYTLYRRQSDTPLNSSFDLTIYDSVSADQSLYLDRFVSYDRHYYYAIQSHTKFDDSPLSDTVSIMPGPVNFWITDFNGHSVKKLTYDGAHQIGGLTVNSPIAVAYTEQNKCCFVANYWENRVHVIARNLNQSALFDVEGAPVDLGVRHTVAELYVIMRWPSQIGVYDFQGNLKRTIGLNFDVSFDTYLTVDEQSHSVWISNYEDNYIYRIKVDQLDELATFETAIQPERIYADPVRGGCWVTTANGILRIKSDATVENYKKGYRTIDLSVNPANGDCYYTGYQNHQWSTGRLSASSGYQDHQILDDEYNYLYALQVIPGNGLQGFLAWQRSREKLLRFSASGSLIGEMESVAGFVDTALE